LIYLMGGDSLGDLPEWYQPQLLVDLADGLGVMRRPGDVIDLIKLEQELPGISEKLAFVDAPLLEISSRQIRERWRQISLSDTTCRIRYMNLSLQWGCTPR